MDTALSGKRSQAPTDRRSDDSLGSDAETDSSDPGEGDPFDDDEVTSVLDAAWEEITS
ncbi:hypothetical protein [Haloarcula laminariae]|uniref:hypothetical protein n=1 Tax=Haloarcula laminariae TaxID=2961577 RepID=UPI0021C60154|nr:hypothetical protein [Halomicroarcula laminariae]